MRYVVVYVFKGKLLFTVMFKGEEGIPDERLEEILEEQAAIMRGQRDGVVRGIEMLWN